MWLFHASTSSITFSIRHVVKELVEIQGRMIIPLAKVENKVVCRLNSSDLIGKEADNTNDGDSGSKPFT